MTLTPDSVFNLLQLAAAFDQRTVGDTDVTAWMTVAQVARWDEDAAKRVLVEYYSEGADKRRVSPADITDGIRTARRDAATTFELPRIPATVSDADYPAWLREQRSRHVDRVVAEWAAGKPIPVAIAAVAETPRALTAGGAPAAVREEIRAGLQRLGVEPRAACPSRTPRRAPTDPHRLAQARAELDTRRGVA